MSIHSFIQHSTDAFTFLSYSRYNVFHRTHSSEKPGTRGLVKVNSGLHLPQFNREFSGFLSPSLLGTFDQVGHSFFFKCFIYQFPGHFLSLYSSDLTGCTCQFLPLLSLQCSFPRPSVLGCFSIFTLSLGMISNVISMLLTLTFLSLAPTSPRAPDLCIQLCTLTSSF